MTRSLSVLTLILAVVLQSGRAQEAERPLWQQEAMLLHSDSSSEFTRLRTIADFNPRLERYSRAVEVLHDNEEQKRERYEAAQDLFELLVEEVNDDAVGLASRYYLARIAQFHPMEKDLQTAKLLYLELFEQHPERFFGQMAFLKYAAIEIYDPDNDLSPLERIQNLEQHVTVFEEGSMRRNFHRVMGEAYLAFDLDLESAYSHFNDAYNIGLPVLSLKIEVLIHIAELGERLGDPERALMAYDELRHIAPRHPRRAEFDAAASRLRASL